MNSLLQLHHFLAEGLTVPQDFLLKRSDVHRKRFEKEKSQGTISKIAQEHYTINLTQHAKGFVTKIQKLSFLSEIFRQCRYLLIITQRNVHNTPKRYFKSEKTLRTWKNRPD